MDRVPLNGPIEIEFQISGLTGTYLAVLGSMNCWTGLPRAGWALFTERSQEKLNRVVAIKMILSGQFAGQDEVQRFYVEAEAAGGLDHPGIVPVFDVGCTTGQHYLSMAFVEGQSLSARIKNEGALPAHDAADLTRKIANAIQVAHDQGIVHRDLKPGNVLLDHQGEPRVTDFGLAKRVEADSKLTTTGMVLGTPSYMPPEQAAGKEIAAAADVYSLGAILYAMLTGRPPFEGSSQLETILQVLQEEPVAPRKIDKKIPKDLEAICLKCLEKNAADRYETAAKLSDDLRRFLAGEPIQAKNDLKRRLRKWTIREPVLATHLMATLILLVVICFAYLIWKTNVKGSEYNFFILKGNVGILLGWAVAVFLIQKTQNIFQTKSVIPFTWAALNPVFLTIAIWWNGANPWRAWGGWPDANSAENVESLGWLFSLYFLLIVASCFFRRAEFVVITTVFSLLGYGVLFLAIFYSPLVAPSYKLIFAVNLAGTGALLSLLTLRIKRLSEKKTT